MLQGFLRRLNRFVEFSHGQLFGGWIHALYCHVHVVDEFADLVVVVEATGAGAISQCLRLLRQRGLQFRQQFGIDIDLAVAVVFTLLADQVPGGHDDLALTLGNFVLLGATAATATTTARQLRLRVTAVVWLDLDKEHVSTNGLTAIAGFGVVGNQIARLQRDLFGCCRSRAIVGFSGSRIRFVTQHDIELTNVGRYRLRCCCAHFFQHEHVFGSDLTHRLFQQIDFLERAAVDGILHRKRLQAIVILGIDAGQHFFNAAGVVVATGFGDLEFGFAVFGQANEVIV